MCFADSDTDIDCITLWATIDRLFNIIEIVEVVAPTEADDEGHSAEDDQRKQQTVHVDTNHLVHVDAALRGKREAYICLLFKYWLQ